MISATHTHTGPSPFGSGPYVKQLSPWIAQAVQQANDRLTAAKISYGSKNESDISFIRRFWMTDGTVGWNPGKLNPNIIRPIGTIDPQVNVIYAETANKKPLLTYVNFANHLDTTGGTRISADFPATLARRLADYRGPEMLTIFANGACGNINHTNVHWDAPQTSPEAAKRLGTILAADVLKSYADMKEVEGVALHARCKMVQLPLAKHTDEELRRAREVLAQPDAGVTFLDKVKASRIMDVADVEGRPVHVEVQVMTLGSDIAWVALPGEIFVELGLSIKAASPFRQTNVVELANGGLYYVPHRSAYAEGQYEVISTRYAGGSGEMLVTAAIELLGELHKQAIGR
jgi:neutral ceramidase